MVDSYSEQTFHDLVFTRTAKTDDCEDDQIEITVDVETLLKLNNRECILCDTRKNPGFPPLITPLHWAAKHGYVEMIKYLNLNDANLTYRSDILLKLVASNGHLDILKYLEQNSAFESLEHKSYGEAFILASAAGHQPIIEHLCNGVVDMKIFNSMAVIKAAENGHFELVEYFCENGIDVNARAAKAMSSASSKGYLEIVKCLHRYGSILTAEDNLAIRLAAKYGHLEVVKYLHLNGANLTAQNDWALRYASANGHLAVVKYLCENGANVTVNGNYPMRMACSVRCPGHTKLIRYLHENGATLSPEDIYPVLRTAQAGDMDTVQYLLSTIPYSLDAIRALSCNSDEINTLLQNYEPMILTKRCR